MPSAPLSAETAGQVEIQNRLPFKTPHKFAKQVFPPTSRGQNPDLRSRQFHAQAPGTIPERIRLQRRLSVLTLAAWRYPSAFQPAAILPSPPIERKPPTGLP